MNVNVTVKLGMKENPRRKEATAGVPLGTGEVVSSKHEVKTTAKRGRCLTVTEGEGTMNVNDQMSSRIVCD